MAIEGLYKEDIVQMASKQRSLSNEKIKTETKSRVFFSTIFGIEKFILHFCEAPSV